MVSDLAGPANLVCLSILCCYNELSLFAVTKDRTTLARNACPITSAIAPIFTVYSGLDIVIRITTLYKVSGMTFNI